MLENDEIDLLGKQELDLIESIQNYKKPALVIGFNYYLIQNEWIKKWKFYYQHSADLYKPGPINQQFVKLQRDDFLWDQTKKHHHYIFLKQYRSSDFSIFTKKQWEYLSSKFGGKQIIRKCQWNQANQPEIEIKLPYVQVKIYDKNSKQSKSIAYYFVQFSKYGKWKDVHHLLNQKYPDGKLCIFAPSKQWQELNLQEYSYCQCYQDIKYLSFQFKSKSKEREEQKKREQERERQERERAQEKEKEKVEIERQKERQKYQQRYYNYYGKTHEPSGNYYENSKGNLKIDNFGRVLKRRETSWLDQFSYYKGDAGGLDNIGNTCYMNSALQCLFHTQQLTQYFQSDQYKNDINYESPFGTKGEISNAFKQLLTEVKKSSESVRPQTFKQVLQQHFSQFRGHDQQDSFELLCSVLDGLQQDLNRNKTNTRGKSVTNGDMDDEQASKHITQIARVQSKIRDIFAGQFKTVIQCKHCMPEDRIKNRTFDDFLQLTIDIEAKEDNGQNKRRSWYSWKEYKECTLTECLKAFTQPQHMREQNKWHCSKSNQDQQAQKQTFIYKTGPILIICLKRMTQTQKKQNKVNFPLYDLDISPGCQSSTLQQNRKKYDLYAVINHSGSRRGGHFTATCADYKYNTWKQFNDSRVRKIDTQDLQREIVTSRAYVLFYRQQK